jgi:hypothetical protein
MIDTINDIYGCDENQPIVISAMFGSRTGIKGKLAQPLFLTFNPKAINGDLASVKKEVTDIFKDTLNDYSSLSDMIANTDQPPPLAIDLKMAKSIGKTTVVTSMSKPVNEHLKSDMIQTISNKEPQMNF